MFNGYNETPLISYNEFNQERLEKKQENVGKWSSYGHETGVQPAQTHPNTRHEFWPGKANFLGVGNVVKCNCTGCYPSDNQSYQGDTTRHRPWLPRTFPVPLNGSNESCKLPAYQWDNGFTGQSPCYSDNNLAYVQENGGKYPYYRAYQNTRIPEPNQPGVITSVKDVEFGKKGKNEMARGQGSPIQNGVFCNPGYNLTKRSYCEVNEKHSNVAPYSVDQHLVRLPVVEPFIKAVPSNISQNRVPSTDYRSVKESMGQSYAYDPRKITEAAMNGDKRPESYPTGQLPTGVHIDYSHINRDLQEGEPQKLYLDNTRHPDYYSRNNIHDVIKRNNQTVDNRKDCAMSQMSMPEQHYRSKYQETFYPKDFDKRPENSACFQDGKTENANVHARLPRSALLFNDPRFADRTQNSFPYQSNPNAYRNYLRPEYPYQGFNPQDRYEYPGGFQRNEMSVPPQQTQNCEQYPASQQIQGFPYENHIQNSDKMQQFYLGKDPTQTDTLDNRKPNYLESIRSEEINKNGTSKISPLRLLRKKKFINVPQEPAPVNNADAPPGLDVRKFWSTWADEEEENVAPTQMVVLDCQNIDPEQAKLLHLYETDPVRAVHLDTGNIVIKNVKEPTEEVKSYEQTTNETKVEEAVKPQEAEKVEENSVPEPEPVEPKICKKEKSGKKKTKVMDKWTEKKFDFLKRAEESKAAEILRHEEEKKKIFETRLSLQQSLKKSEKSQEKSIQFDENSHSGTEDGNTDATNLPTCEYRRNKFLDYAEENVLLNGNVPETVDEVKKEESIKVERSDNPADMLLNVKLREETGFEMDDILKKISEINFEGSEIKIEDPNGKTVRKSKKTKKKKAEQPEVDDRTDKLTLETVTKPTIKFSIQKSHDLKISFKVLNSKEDLGGEDPQDKANALEDSKNSTEFTLRYKTFRGDGDSSGLKQKKFRKKKRNPEKVKKNRYVPEVEKDPLGDDKPKPFADGFQVQETVDSAKIKLTFKRHKGNFETEYKINSNVEEVDDGAMDELNNNEALMEHKSEEVILNDIIGEDKAQEIKSNTDVESCPNSPGQNSEPENDSVVNKTEEDSRNSPSTEEENYDFETAPPIFAECPSIIPFEVTTPENVFDKLEESTPNEETGRETKETDVIDCEPNPEEKISSDLIKSTNSPEIETNHKPEEIENADGDVNCDLENPAEIKLETEMENLISDEGVDGERAKMTEIITGDDSGQSEMKNSPTGIAKELENLEDFISEDFLTERDISKPATPEVDDSLLSAEVDKVGVDEEEIVKAEKQVEGVDETCLPNDSGIAECSKSTIDVEVETKEPEPELEEGEIIESSDESDDVDVNRNKKRMEFLCRKIERRHSECQNLESWSRKKFRKAKSCPPGLTFPETSITDVPVEDIPLPLGPPPLESCWNSEKYKSEAKENSSIFPERVKEPETPSDLEKCRNPSPPTTQDGILHRSSKIKFSISKRSKFSKLSLKSPSPPRAKDDSDKANECQTEEVPKAIAANEKPRIDLESVELQFQDLEENVDPITDLIRDEFYECEDIPTSEDLTNGDDLEIEKVNDDKFRNIMQNCLDNAKKFLNVGNLKLFSCSVDDLLELDCQPDPSLEVLEPEKPTRDVLLTSCGDTEDMGLSENVQPGDISVDFVPSFCSDICPEILPVDNWPYLEEEVTSSPNRPKQDDNDLVPVLENDVVIPDKKSSRVTSFRRASDDGYRVSLKDNRQRRKTIDSSYGREMFDLKNSDEIKSLKCRLSLNKLIPETQNGVSEKSSKNLNYRSPSWQPKVMLLRISKNELRKVLRAKHSKKETDVEQPALKKPKPEPEIEKSGIKPEEGATAVMDTGGRKRKRFRNLHTKRKSETEVIEPEVNPRKGEMVDPEVVLTEIFKNCDAEEKLKKRKERDDEKQKSRHREKHRSSHERSKSDGKHEKERSPRWICEVCGFDEPNERVLHIKNHPFHCQSCHLAFKTESHFINHLTKKHKDIRNQHHCLLCELSFDTEEQYQRHLETREHKHLESVEKNTINTLFTILTGAPCPVLGLVDTKPEWLPNQAGTVHFYHQATPLSLALQYLKMHRDLSSFSTASSTHPT